MKDHPSIVMSNRQKTDLLYIMSLRAPQLAGQVLPGQFVHMELPTLQGNILRRPFSVYDVSPEEGIVDILYQVVGVGTQDMSRWQPGYLTRMIGPIGSPWSPSTEVKCALLVGGGVGAAPLLLLCRQLVARGVNVDVILGAATADALVCKDRYIGICGSEPICSTDDGSYGRKGFATVLVEEAVCDATNDATYDYAAICGPEPLMRSASKITTDAGIPTQVSMERRMACGIGACLSCVVDTVSGKKRACVDGPIFDALEVVW